jgi:hypothetical protein
VNATFTGVHEYDAMLPDWSPDGLRALDQEMSDLSRELGESPNLDSELAQDFLAIQRAENAGTHGVRGNPSLWTGEAIFSVISLMIRDFAPRVIRIESATARLSAIPDFLADARRTMSGAEIPAPWAAKAVNECKGGRILFGRGIECWLASGSEPTDVANELRDAASRADAAMAEFVNWLGKRPGGSERVAAGPELFDLLLARGHRCERSTSDLLAEAARRFDEEQRRLEDLAACAAGSWSAAREAIAADHPSPSEYLTAFGRVWNEARATAVEHDVVSWPDWPIRYVTYPAWTREAVPYLYYLHYRSPAPFDHRAEHDYVVPALPPAGEDQHLRTWNNSVIKLNHVVHHGGIGHHVQNWFAYHRAESRVGQIAAVDCASRIGMFCGGTMAEGWACYVTGLMDELGFLSPLEQVADQHTRVRGLARAIVDIELHRDAMSFDDAVRFYTDRVGMSADAARGETVKNSMFPCTAIMYWLGTQSILDLRSRLRQQRGSGFSLKTFHDDLLAHGSIPVPLIARLVA